MPTDLITFINEIKSNVDGSLDARLNHANSQGTPLYNAMRYSLLLGGKRIRPALVFATAQALQVDASSTINGALDCACALEAIHTYSLIHDDLPAMDDDDLRRGQPSCHKKFDEATAILAGDALQTIAFEWLLSSKELTQNQQLLALSALTKASGARGMVLGQAIDLAAVNSTLSLAQLETMHQYKTGALIAASVELGAICANASPQQNKSLQHYAKAIGLAFQVQDDILDVTGTTENLGKQVGSDAKQNKPTYVSLLGLEGAQKKSNALMNCAIESLSDFGSQANMLRQLAKHVVTRSQ